MGKEGFGERKSERKVSGWQNLLTCAASDVELSGRGKEIEENMQTSKAVLLGAGMKLIRYRIA